MGKLDEHVAVVTGGASGMGAAIVRRLAKEGAIVVVGDVDRDGGEHVANELGAPAVFHELDVSDAHSWDTLVAWTMSNWSRLDILVNNAGVHHWAPMTDTSLEDFARVVAVNQTGCFLGMRAVAPVMCAAGRGSIINTSSTGGIAARPGTIAYTASKFAVRGMTKVAATELGHHGVRVNSIHPGGIATPMLARAGVSADYEGEIFGSYPIPRAGSPDEVAELVLFLASADSSYCTGAEFVIDGGLLAGPAL